MKTNGIVLRETNYQDRDKLLTILTSDYGKLTVKARGVKSNRSTLKAACQLMAYSELTFMEQQGRYILTEAVTKELFTELQENIELLSLASYFLQVTDYTAMEQEPNPQLLSLLLNCLYGLGRLKLQQSLVKAVFELRLCSITGYLPDLNGCKACGADRPGYFHIMQGCLQCDGCGGGGGGIRLPISPGVLDAMRYICFSNPGRLFSFTLSPDSLTELGNLTEAYLCAQLECGFYTLDFYKSLLYGAIP